MKPQKYINNQYKDLHRPMDIHINEVILEKYNLSIAEAIILVAAGLAEKNKLTLDYILRVMKNKEYILQNGSLNPLCSMVLKDITNTSKLHKRVKVNHEFIKTVQSIFPSGKKEGTNIYWRGNSSEIQKKLEIFCSKFPHITQEEIIDATKRYVKSFNGNYNYMRTLKYFISKNEVKNGETNYTSDLLTFIENKNNEEQTYNFSNSELR